MNQIPCEPLSIGSASFATEKFRKIDDHTMCIQPTIRSLIIYAFFAAVGLFFFNADLTMSLMFMSVPVIMYCFSSRQVVIDREKGATVIKPWLPVKSANIQSITKHLSSSDIVAVQVLSTVHKTSSGRTRRRYTQYQVNLCIADNNRLNAFVTPKRDSAFEAANIMSEILNVDLVNNNKEKKSIFDDFLKAA